MFSGFFFLSFSVSPPPVPEHCGDRYTDALDSLGRLLSCWFHFLEFRVRGFLHHTKVFIFPCGSQAALYFLFRLPQVCQARGTLCHFHTIVSLPSLKSSTKKRKVLKCFSSAFPHCYRGECWEDEEEKGNRKKVFGDHRKVRGFFPWKWRDRPDQKTIHRSFVTLSAVSSC